jgi:hypothetical protein
VQQENKEKRGHGTSGSRLPTGYWDSLRPAMDRGGNRAHAEAQSRAVGAIRVSRQRPPGKEGPGASRRPAVALLRRSPPELRPGYERHARDLKRLTASPPERLRAAPWCRPSCGRPCSGRT